MPISEDEYDSRTTYETSTMSKAELRKTHKPIMEKRRRARINHCLNEIKSLILDAMKKDPARHSKLEKADILEMAVKHLQSVQRQQLALAMATDPSVLRKFKAGFNECAEEVSRYINSLEGLDSELQQRISSHLTKCISGIEQIVHLNFPGFGGVPFLTNSNSLFSTVTLNENTTITETPGDQNNNPNFQIPQNLQLIPSRLPTGELALLLPNSNNLPYFSSVSYTSETNQGCSQNPSNKSSRSSAFVTVVPSALSNLPIKKEDSPLKPTSKLLSPPQSPTSTSNSSRQDEVNQSVRNSPSPRGFRPVNSSRLHLNSTFHTHSVTSIESQTLIPSNAETSISSLKNTVIDAELKNIRFPIHKYQNTQKLAEPLSIITNQSERYKHAQILEDTAHYEENIPRGVKRKNEFAQSGLLTVATPYTKILKVYHESNVSDFRTNKVIETSPVHISETSKSPEINLCESKEFINHFREDSNQCSTTSCSKSANSDSNSDMWRPW